MEIRSLKAAGSYSPFLSLTKGAACCRLPSRHRGINQVNHLITGANSTLHYRRRNSSDNNTGIISPLFITATVTVGRLCVDTKLNYVLGSHRRSGSALRKNPLMPFGTCGLNIQLNRLFGLGLVSYSRLLSVCPV